MSRKKMEESLAMMNNGELHSDDVSSTSEEADPSSQEPDIPSIVVVVDPVEEGREVSAVISHHMADTSICSLIHTVY